MNKIIKGFREGYWEQYFTDGSLAYCGCYLHNQLVGYWIVDFNGIHITEFWL